MNPEKEIVNHWLNSKGFFTLTNIKVAENKEIDILAIKLKEKRVEKIVHFEVYCSISSSPNVQEIKEKFHDKVVVKKVEDTIQNFLGKKVPYEKRLVASNADKSRVDDISIVKFEDVLEGFTTNISKYNYRNDVIRTAQLLKYLLLAKPKNLASLIKNSGKNKAMSLITREDFVNKLVNQDEVTRIISKKGNINAIFKILQRSTISAEKLAQKLDKEVLTKRTRKRFIESLLKQKEVKKLKIGRNQKPLQQFFK